ncbi:hypothetical protein DVA86_05065 [Streptomyces armeniacus]|uniref:Helicase C-terminal domain-containing protein n=1 Tax=Streptomyces armeniacus TaxID=83291 RepID=A0A345XKF2_9ACTN|nr:hypothetical protein DVA86_05065 [Streptomyces armeniacus]
MNVVTQESLPATAGDSPDGGPEDQQAPPALDAATPQQIRDELAELVVTDLLGPIGGQDEELDGNPIDHYLIGRLAPAGITVDGMLKLGGMPVDPGTFDEKTIAGVPDAEEGDRDTDAPNIPSLQPSSLGFTARVDGSVDELRLHCSWARYLAGHSSDRERTDRVWHRSAFADTVTVCLQEGEIAPEPVLPHEFPDVVVRGRARRHDGDWLVSLFLVNGQAQGERRSAHNWLFQTVLTASGPDGTAPFLPRRAPDTAGGDAAERTERRSLAMAHRFHPEFAVGHGTGVRSEPSPGDPLRAAQITTTAAPSYEIPHTDVPDPLGEHDADLAELRDLVLDMRELASLEPTALRTALLPLVEGYRAWIERTAQSIDEPGTRLDGYEAEARDNLRRAGETADRIQAGVELLTEEAALEAFRFANEAMWQQRVHTLASAHRRSDQELSLAAAVEAVDLPRNRSWRPFQLAFLLLNLPSLADPSHPERSDDAAALADLLWFPTGGGKTEAYLGLTAFTLAIRRRLRGLGGLNSESGVAVLMRYTLRLLTIQQFQRAAALICACETIRRSDPIRWGEVPFRIGLWVGGSVTPNSTDQAHGWLKDLRKDRGRGRRRGRSGSPHQLTSCPWCGTKLDAGRDISVDTTARRTFIVCPDVFSCPFGMGALEAASDERGLPVLVVDEEIYRLPPSLVIATVDKFAQLPWKGETQTLFGRVAKCCTRHGYVTADAVDSEWERPSHPAQHGHPAARTLDVQRVRPPDLIVQDELHLISGPLGSLTGLYEAAVDRLSTWDIQPGQAVRPKVIASTATVRRAERQIKDLFGRRTAVFPPPGLTMDDNFFARRRSTGVKPGRRYVGICAQGVRTKSVAIRVYVAQLAAAKLLHERYGQGELTDPYMTLVGYFNSLRDLGGMRRLVEDDVSTRLARVDRRGLATRFLGEPAELTSRMSSDAIPDILEKLDLKFAGRKKGSPRPIDVLLATNMIAVGVDVSRLGAMVVSNQPKSTAEYIQATSRVGRQAPGLVFTVLNWARPRDLSHYETFESFHATIYQHVEALSVTPFAERAVDRGLTGVLAALVRDLKQEFNANRGAQFFDTRGELADHVVRYLQRRAGSVTEDSKVSQEIGRLLGQRLDYWEQRRKAPGTILGYRTARRQGDVTPLLKDPDGTRWQLMTCPTSLREVEPPVRLMFVGDNGQDVSDEPSFVPRPQSDSPDDAAQEQS